MKHKARLIAAAGLAVVAVALIFSVSRTWTFGPAGPPHAASDDDAYVLAILQKTPRKAEARSWLERSDGFERTIGKDHPIYTHAQSVAFVDQLYAAGAIVVYAVDIDSEPDMKVEGTRTLIVRLPDDPQKRRRLFAIEAASARQNGFDPEDENGRHYMLFWWD